MNIPGRPIFDRQELRPQLRRALFERSFAAFPGHFRNVEEVAPFLSNLMAPVSGAWVYSGNAKTGTSSTRRFLFELEFGHKLSVSVTDEADANTDPGPHMLGRSGVFRPLSGHAEGLEVMQNALRLATARHPTTRALSAYHYLCVSHQRALPLLAMDRFRMNALVGFDWGSDPGSVTGFEKFLDYVHLEDLAEGHRGGDRHLRPQVHNLRPEVYQPQLIGRTEQLGTFFHAIAERLERPLPADWQVPMANHSGGGAAVHLLTASVQARLAQTYAADYQWLGEEVGSWPV